MPSVTESNPDTYIHDIMKLSPMASKKRRRGGEDMVAADGGLRLSSSSPKYTQDTHFQGTSTLERKLAPLRGSVQGGKHDSKRQRVFLPSTNLAVTSTTTSISISSTDSKVLSPNQGNNSAPKGTGVDLSPCYICHRKPTQKQELNSYGYCEGCGERTCWICFRECTGPGMESTIGSDYIEEMVEKDGSFRVEIHVADGWEGEEMGPWEKGRSMKHRSMVCSRCCVEKGTEGEVWCLGCLDGDDAG